MMAGPTPAQTAGPFLHIGLEWPDGPDVVPADTPGAIWLRGRLIDGNEYPVGDALIETWQADADGRLNDPGLPPDSSTAGFRGLGRCCTGREGDWAVRTVKPGRVADRAGGLHAPHIIIAVFARGLLRHLTTRAYFADEETANAEDAFLRRLMPAERYALLAQATADGYRLDLRLQGEGATPFLDI